MKMVLGTMTFGQQVFFEEAEQMCKTFFDNGFNEIDTAYVYNEGECEKIVGRLLSNIENTQIKIATKVNPRITGRLDAEAVDRQFQESLGRMKVSKIDTLYLHFPDYNTPIESALEACNKWYEKGCFERLGVSNFPAWLVVDIVRKCEKYGWVRPKVYEGLYNSLSRKAESELFDALRALNICFYAYNPLAGGLLTGKYGEYEEEPSEGRFTYRPNYQKRYWKKSYFDGIKLIQKACDNNGVKIVDAAIRWLAYHSLMDADKEDGIIMGASSVMQLKQNITSLNSGDLPDEVLDAMENAWSLCKNDAPEYFRYYRI